MGNYQHAEKITALEDRIQDLSAECEQLQGELASHVSELEVLKKDNELNPETKHTLYKIVYLLVARVGVPLTVNDIPHIVKEIVEKAPTFGLTADDSPVRTQAENAIRFVDSKRSRYRNPIK